jgi:hypothetical protein
MGLRRLRDYLCREEKPTRGKVKEVFMERMLRGIAGAFILASLLLAHYVDTRWLWFTAFVGLNLFQSAFTNWCPMMSLLKKRNIRACAQRGCRQ